MNQQERLDYLVEQFKEDSGEYWNLKTPADTEGKKRILQSLMNIRMPKITPAFNLPSKYILHTVGPIITGRVTAQDCELLASCYRSCLT